MKKTWVFGALGALVLIGVLINYQSIFQSVVPPKPVLVSSYADASSSKLFDYSVKVIGSVRNEGGNGYVIAEATVYQGAKQWTKTERIFLSAYETVNVEVVFDEVRLLQQTPKYHIDVRALGY